MRQQRTMRVAAIAGLALALAACGQTASSGAPMNPTTSPTTAPPPATSATTPAPTLAASPMAIETPPPVEAAYRLVKHEVKDPQINDIVAYSVLVPEGWSFEGKVEWRHDLANLAASILTVEDPESGAAIETYWPVQYDYAQPLLMPVGSNWLGAIVKEPMAAKDYVARVIVPQYRPGAKVVSVESLPKVAAVVRKDLQAVAGGTVDADSVRVRLSTKRGSVAYDEDFYVTLAYSAAGGVYQWGPRNLYSFRAPKGTLDAATPLLESIASSGQVTPLWAANYQIVYGLFVNGQYAAIRAAGELSRHIAQNNDEITASLREGYEAQQAAYDRVFDSFSDYVRGVDRYVVPDVGRVTLPSSYNVCSDGGGVTLVDLGSLCPDGSAQLKPAE